MLDSSSFFGISANRFRSRGPLSRRCGSGILTAGALRTSCLLFLNFGSLAPVPLGALRRRCVCLCRTGSFRLRRACERCVCLPASPAPILPHRFSRRTRMGRACVFGLRPYRFFSFRICERRNGCATAARGSGERAMDGPGDDAGGRGKQSGRLNTDAASGVRRPDFRLKTDRGCVF